MPPEATLKPNGTSVSLEATARSATTKADTPSTTSNSPIIESVSSPEHKAGTTEDPGHDISTTTSERRLSTPPPSISQEPASTAKLDHDSTSCNPIDTSISKTAELEQVISRLLRGEDREMRILAAMVGVVLVWYCLPRINWSTIVAGILGVGLGGFVAAFYLLAVPESTRLKRARTIANFGKHHNQELEIIDGVPVWSNAIEKPGEAVKPQSAESNDGKLQRVSISPDTDLMVEEMISFTLRDFVNVPMGLVSEGQHNIPLRVSLVAMAMNVSNRLSNMRLPETALLGVFGLQNSFIVHLRAYRELRASRLPIAQYVSTHANPDSVLGRCYHKEERLKQFRSTAKAVCQALLSKDDQQSVALFAVMQEIMATHVLESTLEHICDPDYINLSIIDYFSTPAEGAKPDQNTADSAISKSAGTGEQSKEAPMTALADSILMNAAHLMDRSGLQKQGSDPEIRPPVQPSTPQRALPSAEKSVFSEGSTFDRQGTGDVPQAISVVTLKQVLAEKNEHMDTFQDFMAYLQVWDAMDLAQFWLMIDIFHRQVEQGVLTNPEDLRREANNIYETYCGQDLNQSIAGIGEAKGGALLKNLKRNIQRDPANSLLEPQEWALSVLEAQYWVPFKIKQERECSEKKASDNQQRQHPHAPPMSTNNIRSSQTSLQEASEPPEHRRSSSSAAARSNPASPTVPTASSRTKACSVQVTDMVNRRPKTLMSNSDLSYMIEVQAEGGQGWVITRAFQQLEQLQLTLVQQFPVVQRTVFPRWRLQPSDKVCNGIQNFLSAMLAIPEVSDSSALRWFLSKEFESNPETGKSSSGFSQNPASGLLSAMAPLSENSIAIGAAAAQGAKTALRQASEASLSAGRFFKSLGAAVSTGSSPQLTAEDKSARESFESERSIRSVSSTLTLSDQRHQNGTSLSTSATRMQDVGPDFHPRPSFTGDNNRISRSPPPLHSTNSQPPTSSENATPLQKATQPGTSSSNVHHSVHMDESRVSPQDPTPPTSIVASNQTGDPSIEPKKPSVPLLSNDELDLLIETTFTVLEDMMDFSKSQSIRRMTFGMLRELVRKSYRVAINESFSAWVEESTSREKAVETLRWMKDDLFWPNGEWPIPPTASPGSQPAATTFAAQSDEKKDIISIGDEQYEVGADGIAVKVQNLSVNSSAAGAATTVGTEATSTATVAVAVMRTQEEKDATRDKARELIKMMVPVSLATVLGREAVLRGLMDVFDMFQIKELNLGLALSALEMT
ncbi:hypothetical protein BGZ54_008196, partial [Gamsiella multidivaricata]